MFNLRLDPKMKVAHLRTRWQPSIESESNCEYKLLNCVTIFLAVLRPDTIAR